MLNWTPVRTSEDHDHLRKAKPRHVEEINIIAFYLKDICDYIL